MNMTVQVPKITSVVTENTVQFDEGWPSMAEGL